ncbi:MAG TPA: hypothetical protein VKU38_03580 [Ktedonobacteraceae bacterium]|nr:hypothetical protein [Ktedonobacteraceae bacterium]
MEFTGQSSPLQQDLALSSEVLHTLWSQALATLQSLQSPLGITASGPDDQFHAIFGRDSLWTVLLALEAAPLLQATEQRTGTRDTSSDTYREWLHTLSATVLRGLAQLQGKVVNDINEEQPGRIVHEYWNPVPERMITAHWPVLDRGYFGAFDATFLYLITLARVDAYFDDAPLLEERWPNAEAILQWMLEWSDLDQDGRVEYKKRNPEGIGLDNEVWKDSGESIRAPNHLPLVHPVAWVEVQGYAWAAYAAYLTLAKKRQSLDPALEQTIQQRMEQLQAGLQAFWMEDEHFPAMALDGNKQQIPVVATNAGHLLWSQCVSQTEAGQICSRLVQSDNLTPWGLRTLSETAYYYNPLMYHCGAIWPYDNAVVTIGLQRYGFHDEARRIAETVLRALKAFDKPVELYTVQPSRWIRSHHIEQEWFLADYFYACDVQAWTAAAVLYFTAMLM